MLVKGSEPCKRLYRTEEGKNTYTKRIRMKCPRMNVSDFSEWKKYPQIEPFISTQLNMQFRDVRGMLKLPLPEQGIDTGCNFAAAPA